jgi:hypothetical protein
MHLDTGKLRGRSGLLQMGKKRYNADEARKREGVEGRKRF